MTLVVDVRRRLGAFALEAAFESAGRLTAIFGHSGSGKTTLVNLIAGLERPDAGRIAVDGRILVDTASRTFVPVHRRRVGYVFQDLRLFPHLTVRQNLAYGRLLAPRRDRWADVPRIVEMLGIGPLLDRRPGRLSGGEKSRVAVGRHHELELHLFNVQPRLSRHISRFVGRKEREAYMHDRADAAMASAVALVTQAGVPHETHWTTGDRAEEICRIAEQLGVHHIVMGTARKNSITRMLEDSVTHRVLETTPVPVEVITGDAVSRWERWGLPAGVLGAGGLLLLSID